MTKYLVDVPDDLWKAFKLTCALNGWKIKEACPLAITEFIEAHKTEQLHIDVKISQDKQRNLLTFIFETEMRTILKALVEAKKRKAPTPYVNRLKDRLQVLAKKHPLMSPELADEVVSAFKTL